MDNGQWTMDTLVKSGMKSQDVVILFKLISLDLQARAELTARDQIEAIARQSLDGHSTEDDLTVMLLRT